jgi:hypothetical protein
MANINEIHTLLQTLPGDVKANTKELQELNISTKKENKPQQLPKGWKSNLLIKIAGFILIFGSWIAQNYLQHKWENKKQERIFGLTPLVIYCSA